MFDAIVFGLIHGITAFLPLSSFAHRIIGEVLLGMEPPGMAIETALEVGAFIAALLFVGFDWLQMAGNAVGLRFGRDPELRRTSGALWILLAASAPAGLVGYWFASSGPVLRNPFLVGFLIIGIGLAMGWAESSARRQKTIDHLTFADAMLIGLIQSLAVLPGASRMAVTLTGAMLLNFDRAAAVRLSYLLALPVAAGRSLFGLQKMSSSGGLPGDDATAFAGAALASAVAGLATLALFSEYIRQGDLRFLVRYSVVFGIIVIALAVFLR